ncbi:uncharacterized protein LOC135220364 [Macrobrachium nipponense]|uniref:uncharacterized protein LOC135220364 n=1 Tax=Macrobrachium nipponense TaxID=159736 RepID=UPI0030C81B51
MWWASPAHPRICGVHCPPVPGHVTGPTYQSRDTWRPSPARPNTLAAPSRFSQNPWQASPTCPGTCSSPHPPILGNVTSHARLSRDTWWASPACTNPRGGPRPPVQGHLAVPPASPETRGPLIPGHVAGRHPPVLGPVVGVVRPSRDTWQASASRPGTYGGPRPPIPVHMAVPPQPVPGPVVRLACQSWDM